MPKSSLSPNKATTSSSLYRPRQTQSQHNSPTYAGLDGTLDEITTTKSYRRGSSLRPPGKVSGGLIAKVSKFEALDALSVPFTIRHPHLQPAPLHVLHKARPPLSPKTKVEYGKSSESRKVSMHFNPQTRTTEVEARLIETSEIHHEREEPVAERGDLFDSFDVRKLQESLEKVKARIADTTIEVCYKPSSIRLREGLRGQTLSPQAKYVENQLSISQFNTPSQVRNGVGVLVPVSRDRNISPQSEGAFKINTPVRIPSMQDIYAMAIPHDRPFTPPLESAEVLVTAQSAISSSTNENAKRGRWEVFGRGPSPAKNFSRPTAKTTKISTRSPAHENTDGNTVAVERDKSRFPAPKGLITEDILDSEQDTLHISPSKSSRNFTAAIGALRYSQTKYDRYLATSERERARSPTPHQNIVANVVTMSRDKPHPAPERPVGNLSNTSQVQSSPYEKYGCRLSVSIDDEPTRSPSPHEKALGTLKGLFTRCTAKDGVHGSSYSSHMKSFRNRTANYKGRPRSPQGGPVDNTVPHNVVEELNITKRTSFSMRDRINFFDGAMSRGTNTHSRPSVAPPITPVTPKLSVHSRYQKISPGGYERQNIPSSRIHGPVTPRRTSPASSQSPCYPPQNLFFGSPARNPFTAVTSPNSRSSMISDVSPNFDKSPSLTGRGRAEILQEPRGSPQRGIQNFGSRMNQIYGASSNTVRKISRAKGIGLQLETAPNTNSLTKLDKRKVSAKIEQLLQAKNLERRGNKQFDAGPPTSEASPVSPGQKLGSKSNIPTSIKKPAEIKRSRVADMRKMFDGRGSAKNLVAAVESRIPRPSKFTETAVYQAVTIVPDNTASEHTLTSPAPAAPIEPPLPPWTTIRAQPSLMPAPMNAEESPNADRNPIPLTEESPTHAALRRKSKTIGDKMRLFEFKHEDQPIPENSRRVLSKKINRSLKSIFESKGEDGKGRVKERTARLQLKETGLAGRVKGLSGKEVQDIADEFQVPEKSPAKSGRSRTSTLMGKWTWGQDGSVSPEMIVKEAECGLKHPKPLRLAEMTRMMALCREKVGMGSVRYKDKERPVLREGRERVG